VWGVGEGSYACWCAKSGIEPARPDYEPGKNTSSCLRIAQSGWFLEDLSGGSLWRISLEDLSGGSLWRISLEEGPGGDVGTIGLEPITNRLKACCSTIELYTRQSPGAEGVTPALLRSRFQERHPIEGLRRAGGNTHTRGEKESPVCRSLEATLGSGAPNLFPTGYPRGPATLSSIAQW